MKIKIEFDQNEMEKNVEAANMALINSGIVDLAVALNDIHPETPESVRKFEATITRCQNTLEIVPDPHISKIILSACQIFMLKSFGAPKIISGEDIATGRKAGICEVVFNINGVEYVPIDDYRKAENADVERVGTNPATGFEVFKLTKDQKTYILSGNIAHGGEIHE